LICSPGFGLATEVVVSVKNRVGLAAHRHHGGFEVKLEVGLDRDETSRFISARGWPVARLSTFIREKRASARFTKKPSEEFDPGSD
jgi:hypothetical protein